MYKKSKKEFPIKYIRSGMSEEMINGEPTGKKKRDVKKPKFSVHIKTRGTKRKTK